MLSFILHLIAIATIFYAGMRFKLWQQKAKRAALKRRIQQAQKLAQGGPVESAAN